MAGAVRARLARLDEQLAAGAALRGRLERVLDAAASTDDLLAAIEGMTMLVEQFTGGDAGIERSLRSMYEAEGAEAASRGGVDAELMAYVGRALAQD